MSHKDIFTCDCKSDFAALTCCFVLFPCYFLWITVTSWNSSIYLFLAQQFPSSGFYCWGGGALLSYPAAQSYTTISIMRKWKKPQKEGSGTSVARSPARVVAHNLHSIVLQLERSSQSKNSKTAQADCCCFDFFFFFLRKRKHCGSGREWPLCGWKNNSHIGTRKNYSAAPVWARR